MKGNVIISSLHMFAAIILLIDAAFLFFVHPLGISTSTITFVLAGFGSTLLIQELSTFASKPTRYSLRMLSTYLSRSVFFLLTAAVIFDGLSDAPCHVQLASTPYPSLAAKFNISPGATLRDLTMSNQHATYTKATAHNAPPVFGAAFYLAGGLAPRCVKVDSVPGQPEGSVAWLNVGTNGTARCLVATAFALTMVLSASYLLLAILHRSGNVKPTRSMECEQRKAQIVQHNSNLVMHQPDKKGDPNSSTCFVDLYPVDRHDKCRNHRSVSPDIGTASAISRPSTRRQRSTSTTQLSQIAVDARQGTASTTDGIYRIQPIDASCVANQAGSGTVVGRDRSEIAPLPPLETQCTGRYGYGGGYDRTVDFASGCIMHYPLFSKKKRDVVPPLDVYPTLAPPDFSKSSIESPAGLSPRIVGKARLSASSKVTTRDTPKKPQEELCATHVEAIDASDQADTAHSNNSSTTTTTAATALVTGMLLSPLASTLTKAAATTTKTRGLSKHRHFTPSCANNRLGTADSSLSIPSTFSAHSRPSTGNSTRSANSTGLIRRTRGLLAALELHLGGGGGSRGLSAVSFGSGRGSFDSNRTCSAGTFGDGVDEADSPLATARPGVAFTPRAPAEQRGGDT
ncbi:hypothetical protein NDA18_002606 [Ustilago nuda]|nr:hypothetical protein NDA18_002606 [Ustilago nuda]